MTDMAGIVLTLRQHGIAGVGDMGNVSVQVLCVGGVNHALGSLDYILVQCQ